MNITFNERFRLPVAEVYEYFRTPADWTRLYGMVGDPTDLGNGWYSIGLKGFPFPLVAKNVENEPEKLVRWVFRGFWRGKGEVRFEEIAGGVVVTGFEEITVRWLFSLSSLVEKAVLERRFRTIWDIGWHRLHKREPP